MLFFVVVESGSLINLNQRVILSRCLVITKIFRPEEKKSNNDNFFYNIFKACISFWLGLRINQHGLCVPLHSVLERMNLCNCLEGKQRSESVLLYFLAQSMFTCRSFVLSLCILGAHCWTSGTTRLWMGSLFPAKRIWQNVSIDCFPHHATRWCQRLNARFRQIYWVLFCVSSEKPHPSLFCYQYCISVVSFSSWNQTFCFLFPCSYAELPKDVKNSISHRYRALAVMSEHFCETNNFSVQSKRKKQEEWPDLKSSEYFL